MAVFLRIVLLLALCYAAFWLVRSGLRAYTGTGPPREPRRWRRTTPKNKCGTCRYAGKVFDDGTLCRYGGKETFMKPVHVSNCTDHRPAAG